MASGNRLLLSLLCDLRALCVSILKDFEFRRPFVALQGRRSQHRRGG